MRTSVPLKDFENVLKHCFEAHSNFRRRHILLGPSQEVDSIVYKWNERTELFEKYQAIMTIGAYDWTYFSVEGYHFLALAQAFNGITTLFESRIYVFQKNGFYLFQTIEVIQMCS
jgi:hypothetical protein